MFPCNLNKLNAIVILTMFVHVALVLIKNTFFCLFVDPKYLFVLQLRR